MRCTIAGKYSRSQGIQASLISSMLSFASASGGGTKIWREKRPGRFIAGSTSHGMRGRQHQYALVVLADAIELGQKLIDHGAVCSEFALSGNSERIEPSKNSTQGDCARALSKIAARFLSLSPSHMLRTSEMPTDMNSALPVGDRTCDHRLPQPGGP